MNQQVKFAGVEVRVGQKTYIVPPLSFRQLRELKDKISKLRPGVQDFDDDTLDAFVDVIQAALSRNYPEVTREDLENDIDLGNVTDLVLAVTNTSGLVPKTNISVQGGGEDSAPLTGMASTAESSPQPDGTGST